MALTKRNTGRGGGRKPKELVEGEEVSVEEKTRREQRRERNKEAAARCRKRRMDQDSCLQEQVDELLVKKTALEAEMNSLKGEQDHLKLRLIDHVCKRSQRSSVIQLNGGPEKCLVRNPIILEKVAESTIAENNKVIEASSSVTLEKSPENKEQNNLEKEEIPPSESTTSESPGITVNDLIEASKGFKNSFAGKSKTNNENQTKNPISINDLIDATNGIQNSLPVKSKPTNKENEIQPLQPNLPMHTSLITPVSTIPNHTNPFYFEKSKPVNKEDQVQIPQINLTTQSSSGISANQLIESTKSFKNSFSKKLPKLDLKPAYYQTIPTSNSIGPINIVSPITTYKNHLNQPSILVNTRVGEKGSKGVVLQHLIPIAIPTTPPVRVNPTNDVNNIPPAKPLKTLVPKPGMAKGCTPEITVKQLIDSVKGFKNSFAKPVEQVQNDQVQVFSHIPEIHTPTVLYTEPSVQKSPDLEVDSIPGTSAQGIMESEKSLNNTFTSLQSDAHRRTFVPFKGITKVKPTNIVYPSIPDPIQGDSERVQVRPTEISLKQLIETTRFFNTPSVVESQTTSPVAAAEEQPIPSDIPVNAINENENQQPFATPISETYSCSHCEFKTMREDYFKMHIPCAQSLELCLSNDDEEDDDDDLVIDDRSDDSNESSEELDRDNVNTQDIIKKIKPLVQYKCNSCVSIFNKKINLKHHIEKVHLEQGPQDLLSKRDRGRPTRKTAAPITPKVPRKSAKLFDKTELAKIRRQRKIDLNREASKRFRKNKRLKGKVLEIEYTSLAVVRESLRSQLGLIENDISKLRSWIESRGIKAEFKGETYNGSSKKLEKSKKVCLSKKTVKDFESNSHPNPISINKESISKIQPATPPESAIASNNNAEPPHSVTFSPSNVLPAVQLTPGSRPPISILPDPSVARSPLTGSRRVIAIIPGPLLTSKRQMNGSPTAMQTTTQQLLSPPTPQSQETPPTPKVGLGPQHNRKPLVLKPNFRPQESSGLKPSSSQVIRLSPAIATTNNRNLAPRSPHVPPPLLPQPPVDGISQAMSNELCLLPKEPLPIEELASLLRQAQPISSRSSEQTLTREIPTDPTVIPSIEQTSLIDQTPHIPITTSDQTRTIEIRTTELIHPRAPSSTNEIQVMETPNTNQTVPIAMNTIDERLHKAYNTCDGAQAPTDETLPKASTTSDETLAPSEDKTPIATTITLQTPALTTTTSDKSLPKLTTITDQTLLIPTTTIDEIISAPSTEQTLPLAATNDQIIPPVTTTMSENHFPPPPQLTLPSLSKVSPSKTPVPLSNLPPPPPLALAPHHLRPPPPALNPKPTLKPRHNIILDQELRLPQPPTPT